ncbi:MAG: NusG domain II-containing protein [Clostridiales bacterium]
MGLGKTDKQILAVILAAALALLAFQYFSGGDRSQELVLEISRPGEERLRMPVSSLPQGEQGRWHVEGAAGGVYLSYWPDQGVHVDRATCPDQACVKTGFISKAGQSIVCVPNEIIIRLIALDNPAGQGEGELDGVLK